MYPRSLLSGLCGLRSFNVEGCTYNIGFFQWNLKGLSPL